MRILFLNWRDIKNPQAGGAEVVTHELAKALAERGDRVDFFAASFPGAPGHEKIDGIDIYRGGSRYTVPGHAYRFYKNNKPFDLVIDQCNTNQFFTFFYVPKKQRLFFIHQLTRQIWFYQLAFPLNLIGYLFEPIFIFLHRKSLTITVSRSTKQGLIDMGLNPKNVFIIPEGLDSQPLNDLPPLSDKNPNLSLIYVGRLVRYKRVHEAIKVMALLKSRYPKIHLDIVGNGEKKYLAELKKLVSNLGLQENIKFLGRVSREQRNGLMARAWFILVTSVLEGWGLIVTEANAFGTPAGVYNVGGLRDSVIKDQTGLIVENKRPDLLAEAIWSTWQSHEKYSRLRQAGWEWSRTLTFENMRQAFLKIIDRHYK